MNIDSKIIVTGAAGFIGSCLAGYLNRKGYNNLILVDDFSREDKKPNYQSKKFLLCIEREQLFAWLEKNPAQIEFVFHLGARTDTTEFDYSVHEKLNVEYSKQIWKFCSQKKIPLLYASSAATYGGGEYGYNDDHDIVQKLQPLNPYGVSKNEFDKWALGYKTTQGFDSAQDGPPFWAGLKFFNVYGPNEYHKGRMASVIFHAYNQIKNTGHVKLFRSHNPSFRDGEQLRDFIYVDDVLDICFWFFQNFQNIEPGLYNVGTGRARTFKDLVAAIFKSTHLEPHIEFIDTPADIRDNYQYFTQADMNKLRSAGYVKNFYSLEKGIDKYVECFLQKEMHY